ncbi:MAG: ferrochelatase [Acidimicrobiales bacterium]
MSGATTAEAPRSGGGGPIGVVVMAYGTPASPEDIEAYYTHIRRGRPPTPEQLANLRMRYDALGGTSTLAARTADQVAVIADALEELAPGRFIVALGQKHAAPFVEDGVAALVAAGATDVVGVVLAPHYSAFSVGQYLERAGDAAQKAGVGFRGVERWWDLPEYRWFLADAVEEGLALLTPKAVVAFTAHSLPERVLVGDPYPDELTSAAESVMAVAKVAPLGGWIAAWQSAGATPEPWRGPDILEVIRELGESGEREGILVCPHGFVSDHLEVAYDLDIEAQRLAQDVGLDFRRTRVLNDDPKVLGALARRIAEVALG